MMAHVAEAAEGRGRMVLRCCSWSPNRVAIDAALLVAHAFQSEVEVLFVEDNQRIDFSRFPFACEFSLRDGKQRRVSTRGIRAEARAAFAVAREQVKSAASKLEVHIYEQTVRDDPVHALAAACAQRGPWNMIAIAETFGVPAPFSLDELFDTVTDATGVIIAGPEAVGSARQRTRHAQAREQQAPIVLAVEDSAHLQAMLRAGRFIAAAIGTEVIVLLVANTDEDLSQMESEVRLVLANRENVKLAQSQAVHGEQAAAAEAIRRLGPGFLIAQYGGIVVPRGKSLRPLTSALTCPLLLVR